MSATTKTRRTMLATTVTIPTVPAPADKSRGGHDRDRRHFACCAARCP